MVGNIFGKFQRLWWGLQNWLDDVGWWLYGRVSGNRYRWCVTKVRWFLRRDTGENAGLFHRDALLIMNYAEGPDITEH